MPKINKDDVSNYIARYKKLKTNKQPVETICQEIAEYMLPERATFFANYQSDKKSQMSKIYEGTALDAIAVATAGIGGMLTNPALPWEDMEMEDYTMNKNKDVIDWMGQCVKVMRAETNDSNFYTSSDDLYREAIGFGNACEFIGEGKKNTLNFKPIPFSEICWAESKDGEVDTVFRSFEYSARQAVQEWGLANLTLMMRDSLKNSDKDVDKLFKILHVCTPRSDREQDKKTGNYKQDKFNMPYLSCYIELGEEEILDEGGFEEMPYACPRMRKEPNSPYGVGMGRDALPDVKMLNMMEKYGIRGWTKTVDPPTVGPDEGMTLPLKTGPGGHTYNSNWDKPGADIKLLYGSGHSAMLPNYENKLEQKREQVRRFFYYKQFQTQQQGQPRTAQEIIQIASENLKILGPVLSRFQPEFLKTSCERKFGILLRAGKFPPTPDVLKPMRGQKPHKWKAVFISPISKAQKLYEVQELQNAYSMLVPVAQTKPEVLDNIDSDRAYDEIAELYPVLRKISKKPEDVQAIRAERQKKIELQEGLQASAATLSSLKTASETQPDGGILGQLTGNVGAQ